MKRQNPAWLAILILSVAACGPPDHDGDGILDDCDDDDPAVHAFAAEVCDGIDNDCDGLVDDGWVADLDGDGVGSGGPSDCAAAIQALADDCDDADPTIHRGAPEACNDVDDDCDGAVDEGLPAYAAWPDGDLDGYGPAGDPVIHCLPSTGWAAETEDCDDADPIANPGEPEYCDGVDNDCDGEVDEDSPFGTVVYQDNDADDLGNPDEWMLVCGSAPDGWSTVAFDCDDTDPSVPFATEQISNCDDGKDNNCNGLTDDEDPGCQ